MSVGSDEGEGGGGAKRLLIGGAVAILLIGVLAVFLRGCEAPVTQVVERSGESDANRCAALLESGLAMCQPETLGLESDSAQAAHTLTTWLTDASCARGTTASPISASDRAMLQKLLGEEEVKLITGSRVTEEDCRYIRDCLLNAKTVELIRRNAGSELEGVVMLFSYVCRQIVAAPPENMMPLTAYQTRVTGVGMAADRAAVFAELLRQAKIDCVIIRSASASANGSAAPSAFGGDDWWVGVLLDQGVYLFDPRIGLPIPAAKAELFGPPTLMPRPATLTDLKQNPGLIADMRIKAGLSRTGEQTPSFDSLQVELISPPSSRRVAMERIESAMPIEAVAVLLFDPLHDTPNAEGGLYQRVVNAGQQGLWKPEQIRLWRYIDQRRELLAERVKDPQASQISQGLWSVYEGPVSVTQDEQSGEIEVAASGQLWKTRLTQLNGHPDRAIMGYLNIRGQRMLPDIPQVDQAMRNTNAVAADEADFWIAQSQYDLRQYQVAGQTANSYLGRNGNRAAEAVSLLLYCMVAEGQTAEVIQTVGRLSPGFPDLPRLRWLARTLSERQSGSQDSGISPLLRRPDAPATAAPQMQPPPQAQPPEEPAASSAEPAKPVKPAKTDEPSEPAEPVVAPRPAREEAESRTGGGEATPKAGESPMPGESTEKAEKTPPAQPVEAAKPVDAAQPE